MKVLALTALLVASMAWAQDQDGGSAPMAEPNAPPPAEAAAAPAPPVEVGEQVVTLKGRLDALDEQFQEVKSSVTSMGKLKFSGYVQGQYVYAENSAAGVDAKGAPAVKDGFSVRRGRLKATYTGTVTEYVLQIDASSAGVALKDAEAHLIEPWTGHKLELVVGQMKWPFGYEVLQSSSEREFPERTRVVRAFLPGERDRGAKIAAKVGILRFQAGVFDGNGTQASGFVGVDNDTEKDIIGRLGIDLKWLAVGASGWLGKTFRPGVYTGPTPQPGAYFPRQRIGFDAQLYLDVLPIGGTAIKGEFIAGQSYFASGLEKPGATALGWWALVSQTVLAQEQVAVRYDYFDPATGTLTANDATDPTKPLSTNPVGTLGLAYIHHFEGTLKATVSYEFVNTFGATNTVDPKDNILTVRLQAKF